MKQSSSKIYKFSVNLMCYIGDPSISPYNIITVKEYIRRTNNDLRGQSTQLFISFHKSYKPVSRFTISRWFKRVLEEAVIDISVFAAHSARSAE